MMSNLFSIFDTSTNTSYELNWISSGINLLLMPLCYWLFGHRILYLIKKLQMILFKELKIILSNQFNQFNSIFLIALFFFILINNLMGLNPYVFTCSSHLIFSISISLPLWLSLMIFSWLKNYNYMFSHLIPQGTPKMLMPFMVLIETISNIIRPGTLSVRLTANMIAGHLLLTLLSQSAVLSEFSSTIIIINLQLILFLLEFSVSIIQSYVFVILGTLYLKETN